MQIDKQEIDKMSSDQTTFNFSNKSQVWVINCHQMSSLNFSGPSTVHQKDCHKVVTSRPLGHQGCYILRSSLGSSYDFHQ